ncbi:MAG: nuclear transport factor 2 family protein [Nocardioidaceae bacterium]|nr:MAG: nuclear transport factor 2 family protein [Nocardioidaceae bacterium]
MSTVTEGTPVSAWFSTSSPVLQAWKQAMDGMLEGDITAVRQAFADDAIWYDMFVGTVRGNGAIADIMGGLKGRSFTTSTVEVRNALTGNESGAIEWVQTLHTGERSLTIEGTSWVTVIDGRISRLWDYVQPIKDRKP